MVNLWHLQKLQHLCSWAEPVQLQGCSNVQQGMPKPWVLGFVVSAPAARMAQACTLRQWAGLKVEASGFRVEGMVNLWHMQQLQHLCSWAEPVQLQGCNNVQQAWINPGC